VRESNAMNWTLEVVIVPVSDLDRSKKFYSEQLGFNVDFDTVFGDKGRIIQLTPPGPGARSSSARAPCRRCRRGRSRVLQLVVNDIHKAHSFLVDRGVEVTEVQKARREPGTGRARAGQRRLRLLRRPDGNSWTVQQISDRG
jgi:catechol 2,3-dioxygenase-like lactoylglutathione lyase family enzyme